MQARILADALTAQSDTDGQPAAAVAATWRDRAVTVVAGPTREAIDPIRYLSNRSTGVFGYALAAAAVRLGAAVTLISGPTALAIPDGLDAFVRVESAAEMGRAVADALRAGAGWLFMAAAVADYAPDAAADAKLKKEDLGDVWTLQLQRTTDILGEVVPAARTEHCRIVGFALETDELLQRATAKLHDKGMDFVIANDPTTAGSGFGAGRHQIHLLAPQGTLWQSESLPKSELANEILTRLAIAVSESGGET